MSWEVLKVSTPEDLKRFVRLPHRIYRNDPCYIPPLEFERLKFLNARRNPFFEHAEVDHFIVTNAQGQEAGRISTVLDRSFNEYHNERTGFFGMFECIQNAEAARTLLEVAQNWCRTRKLDTLRGPMNLSTNHECGLLVEGFHTPPVFGITYNPPYYAEFIENCGFQKTKDLINMGLVPLKVPDYMVEAQAKLLKRGRFKIRTLRPQKFEQELEIIWDVYNDAWSANWGFIPMTKKEFWFAAMDMKAILIPELCLIAEVQGEPVGFSLSLPDFNQTLRKVNGKLFPFGWFHLAFGRRKADAIRTLTLGVKKKFRRLGIDLVFYTRTYQWGVDQGINLCDQSWVLEDNKAMVEPILRLGGYPYKRHRIYERQLGNQ